MLGIIAKQLLRVIRDGVPKRTIVVRIGDKRGLMTGVSWPTVRSRKYIECRGIECDERSIGKLVFMLSLCMNRLNEHSLNLANHS